MGNNQNSNIISETKGRGLFYGVIAIATFIIMAVGATFAYFTATTQSMNSSVQTGSTTLELEYISYGRAWMADDLIPADTAIVEYSFESQNDTKITNTENRANALCKDDFGNSICSVYVFQVKNTAASPQTVSLDVVSETNGFSALHAMAYEISLPPIPEDPEETRDYDSKENNNGSGDPLFRTGSKDSTEGAIDVVDGLGAIIEEADYDEIYINRNGVNKTLLKWVESRTADSVVLKPAIDMALKTIPEDAAYPELKDRKARIADEITIDGGATKTIALVLYIKNANVDQTKTDAKKAFTGQVIVSSGDGSTGVSGTINAFGDEENDALQSNQTE